MCEKMKICCIGETGQHSLSSLSVGIQVMFVKLDLVAIHNATQNLWLGHLVTMSFLCIAPIELQYHLHVPDLFTTPKKNYSRCLCLDSEIFFNNFESQGKMSCVLAIFMQVLVYLPFNHVTRRNFQHNDLPSLSTPLCCSWPAFRSGPEIEDSLCFLGRQTPHRPKALSCPPTLASLIEMPKGIWSPLYRPLVMVLALGLGDLGGHYLQTILQVSYAWYFLQ